MHTPVLLQKVIDYLEIKPRGLYIDATFGEGGYAKEILKKGGKVLGIDLDREQISNFQFSILKEEEKKRLFLVEGNFAEIEKIAKKHCFFPVDGIIFDLGLSMSQINFSKRGFSYKNLDEPLDMRLGINSDLTAEELLKKSTTEELYQVLAKNSEEKRSFLIAQEIKKEREMKKVEDLIRAIKKAIGKEDENVYRRVFQAIRIVVNNELENLKNGLDGALKILKDEGRLIVISFHSIEDRLVKKFIKKNKLTVLNKKDNFKEKDKKKFERSAKLRVILKKNK